MKQWKGKKYWVGGFTNEYNLTPNKNTLKFEDQQFKELTSVVRMTIVNENGETIYDEQKESPLAPTTKKVRASKGTKKKKTVRKATRSGDEWKGGVCRPQDS